MTSEQIPENNFREMVLRGRTPAEYIEQTLAEEESFNRELRPELPSFTAWDKAGFILGLVERGIIEENDIASVVPGIGLSEHEVEHFLDQIIPEAKEAIEQDRKLHEMEAAKQRVELAEAFSRSWGVDRISAFADIGLLNIDAIRALDPSWANALERFPEYKPELERIIAGIEDPEAKAMALMRNLFYVSNLHPSETMEIFRTEQKTGTYVYQDSLFRASYVLHQLKTERDPDFSVIKFGGGGMMISMNFTSVDDPESMKRKDRKDRLSLLQFGAVTPFEVTSPDKNVFQPGLASQINQFTILPSES